MANKIYRSAQGRPVDMEQIRLQNEMVPALGNMRVNARGDELGVGGQILRTREQIMAEHYKATVQTTESNRPTDTPVLNRAVKKNESVPSSNKQFKPANVAADVEELPAEPTKATKAGGLANATKKAKEKK